MAFPPKDLLPVFGIDVPVPVSKDDLPCKYNEDEKNPLILTSLRGYPVPPEGIKFVSKSGSGHTNKIVYGNGTFRKNDYAINAVHGTSSDDMQLARATAKKTAIMEGILEAFADAERVIDVTTEAGMLKEQAKVVTEKVLAESSAREARMWFNDTVKIFGDQDAHIDALGDLQGKFNKLGIMAIDALMSRLDEEKKMRLNPPTITIVDADEPEFGFDLDGDDEN